MGRRILVSLISAIAVAIPQWGFALGLGEIVLKSDLNQPLNAEIQLLEVRDLTENEILVGLASPQDFERVGVDRPYFLTDLRFKVQLTSPSGPVIRVTSRKPVREPFLNFVLQAQWPSGRLLREYTLLMDLPVFSAEQSQPVAAAQTRPTVEQTTPPSSGSQPGRDSRYNPRSSFDDAPARPTGGSRDREPSNYASTNSSYTSDDTYTVRANDTLWEIARQVRPDRGVSIQQTMLAMQRLNPEAFINNNINLLKKGQILRIPDREEMVSYNQRQAVNEVAQQNMRWSGDPNGGFAATSGAQLEGSRSYESASSQSESAEGRVKLSSPEDYSGASEGRATGAGESSLDSLENELAITLEQLDKTERENTDLRSRISSLEEQINTMERMIEITNEEMRALELSAEKNAQQVAEAGMDDASMGETGAASDIEPGSEDELTSGEGAGETGIDEPAGSEALTEEPVVEATPEPTAEPTVAPTAAPTVAPNKVVIPAKPPEKTIVDHILDNIIFIGLGLVVILGGVFAFLKFRDREPESNDFEDDFLEQPMFDEPAPEPAAEEEGEELDLGELEEDIPLDEEQEVAPEEPEPVAEPQTEDVVAEADIYIAYGKYDQAEEMLTKAIAKDPTDPRIRTKLLEVYSTQQDIERFDVQYAGLMALGDAEANDRAAQLRETIEGASPFDEAAAEAVDEHLSGGMDEDLAGLESETQSDFDELSLDLDDETEEPVGEDEFTLDLGDEPSSDDSDFDLSLDLDSEDGDGDLSIDFDTPEPETTDTAEDFSLDLDVSDSAETEDDGEFDLSLGEEESGAEPELDADEFDLGDLSLEDNAGDFELEDTEDSASLDLDDMAETEEAFDLDLDLDDTDASDDEALPNTSTRSYDLSDLEDLSEDTSTTDSADLETSLDDLEPEVDEDAAPLSVTQEMAAASEADDLDLSGDLDLSALDEELDALTSGLSVEGADIADIEMTDAAPKEDDSSASLAQPTVMEEPVTDFDDLDAELGLDSADLGEDLEAGLEIASETPAKGGSEADGEELFNEALANVPESDLDFEIPDVDPEGEDDLGFLSDSDETATKLDLARAYIDMGDAEGAKDILDEIMKEGNSQQKQEAESLMAKV